MKISLGPAPLSWGRERLKQFYKEMAESEVDNFYLGEIFCPKRARLFREDLKKVADLLRGKGKRIYVSSYALIRREEEIEDLRFLLRIADGIEINNIAVLEMEIKDKELVAGPFLNIYNTHSASYLKRFAVRRIVMPPELSWQEASRVINAIDLEFEYIVHGSLPLAVSPVCYTARSLGLDVIDCHEVCLRYPEGMHLRTLSGETLFQLTGPGVVSAKIHCLISFLHEVEGLNSIRIEPQTRGTRDVVGFYRRAIDDRVEEGREILERYSDSGLSNGWFFGEAGWEYCKNGGNREIE